MAESISTNSNKWDIYEKNKFPAFHKVSQDDYTNLKTVGDLSVLSKNRIRTPFDNQNASYETKIFFSGAIAISLLLVGIFFLAVIYNTAHPTRQLEALHIGEGLVAGSAIPGAVALFFGFRFMQLKRKTLTDADRQELNKSVMKTYQNTLERMQDIEKDLLEQLNLVVEVKEVLLSAGNSNEFKHMGIGN